MIVRFRDLARAHQFAIIAPDAREDFGWEVGDKQGDVTPDLTHTLNCIEWVRSHGDFLIDDSHVLITGYSGGGSSAPYIGSNRPGFTHIAVLHGGVFAGGSGPYAFPRGSRRVLTTGFVQTRSSGNLLMRSGAWASAVSRSAPIPVVTHSARQSWGI